MVLTRSLKMKMDSFVAVGPGEYVGLASVGQRQVQVNKRLQTGLF
jgi:hypothetical protein